MIAVWSTLWFPRFLQHSVIQRPAECWRKRRWLLHQTQRRQEVYNSYKAFIVVAKTLKGHSLENQHVWTVWSSSGLQNDIFFFGVLLNEINCKSCSVCKAVGDTAELQAGEEETFIFSFLHFNSSLIKLLPHVHMCVTSACLFICKSRSSEAHRTRLPLFRDNVLE